MTILILHGPNLNLLGIKSSKSGKKLTVDDYNIDPALTKTFPKQMQIIEDYKKKKLAWQ